MDQVDFRYVGHGGHTIYKTGFDRYLHALFILKRSKDECSKLLSKTEKVFEYLVNKGTKYGFDVDSILEIPSLNGSTCFSTASKFSKKISFYIMNRDIKVNSIDTAMMVPDFSFPDLALQMMEKGINPKVISWSGNSRIDLDPLSFASEEAKQLLFQFPRSTHFSIDDITCSKHCSTDCSSSFEKFYFKNGKFVEMTEANRIGQGGFGSVFKGKFHGQDKALKCVLIGRRKLNHSQDEELSDFEKNISEIRIQMASGGSGIIVPEAFVRQQNQEKDDNRKWIAKNYNIYVYPLYDCNLDELHQKHFDNFTEKIIGNIIHQCFNRKGFHHKIHL